MNIELEIIQGTPIFILALYSLLSVLTIALACRLLYYKLTPAKVFGTLIFINSPNGKEPPPPIFLRGGRTKTIGRSNQCDIVLSDETVAEFHARLDAKKRQKMYLSAISGRVVIRDFISETEKDIQPQGQRLLKGSVFKIGEYEIQWT